MNGRIKTTEAPTNRVGLPIIGKIKVGYVDEAGNPVSVDWFVPRSKYDGLFTSVYGNKPKTIQIVFPSDHPEKVCNEYYEYRDNEGGLIAIGDGENFEVWNARKGCYEHCTVTQEPDLMNNVSDLYPSNTGWKITLTLTFILPRITGVMGCWQFQTQGSRSTVANIRDTFDSVLESNGKVRGVLFDLTVRMATSQKPGSTVAYPVVSLVPNESEANIKLLKGCLGNK